ncbi:MAG: MBL fold metallo-hydrolase [Lentisphaeria bacterium]|nr:MBL fold metallo-hydrolase [Lentisphaeria bacterium]
MGDTVADPDIPKLLQPAAGVCVRQEIDNIAWLELDGEILVVDALEQPSCEREVLEAIAETTGDKRVRWVVNTHTHYDHIALNSVFQERFGAEIVNLETVDIPAEGLWLGDGEHRVQVVPMTGCHTATDCVVHAPWANTLLVGDIFGWGLVPWDLPLDTEKLEHIFATYARLIDYGAETVVPGHGPLCSTKELERWVSYVKELVVAAVLIRDEGVPRAEARDRFVPPPDMADWWRFVQWKHEDTVMKITQSVYRGKL